jgi:hypothetical protein
VTWHVHAGDKETRTAVAAMVEYEEAMLQFGLARRTIYLNGGSQTRRDVVEDWREYARARNMRFELKANCIIVLGGT